MFQGSGLKLGWF